ncbi:TetR/AcrR family transcriptional regulator [Salicibibacter kimchii]|uniref:TetR/AcrR family transcriptional regulator n=1 Tax=Salicibibacter kimchii TaxID=2099786 RepID=A0A345BXK9_9BACI|nr:TetR/AcrR family transcriptional regulator [Salicibibacter kimchii]AXF55690.1 TetR/AcrR family transcriptional regulator [Salicibibacter kimchii]
MNKSVKKEALLNVAERLFYEHGFRGVGLKQIIREADVATMTLYNHFSSKEHLVEEVLKQREDRYWSYLDHFVQEEDETPFLSAVKAHGEWLEEESYQGDMFLRAIEDYVGANNDIENIARSHKSRLLRYFQTLAKRIDEDNHNDLAHYFTLLLEGTTSMTTLYGAEKATEYAMAMANKIVYPPS